MTGGQLSQDWQLLCLKYVFLDFEQYSSIPWFENRST